MSLLDLVCGVVMMVSIYLKMNGLTLTKCRRAFNQNQQRSPPESVTVSMIFDSVVGSRGVENFQVRQEMLGAWVAQRGKLSPNWVQIAKKRVILQYFVHAFRNALHWRAQASHCRQRHLTRLNFGERR